MNNINILNRIFAASTFDKIVRNESNIYFECVERIIDGDKNEKNLNYIKRIYRYLSLQYRNEYYYLNTLLNELLIKNHTIDTTVALSQLQVGNSKIDLALINGKATAYEIKTELDNLDKLTKQIRDYYKVFDRVCVVSYDKNIQKIIEKHVNKNVGLYIVDSRNKIIVIKEPKTFRENIDPKSMFKILHKHEFEKMVKSYYKVLPNTCDAFYYDECFKLFSKIKKEDLYKSFLKILKERNCIDKTVYKLPYELRSLWYFKKCNISAKLIFDFLKKEYGG